MDYLNQYYLQDSYIKIIYEELDKFKNKLIDIDHDKTSFVYYVKELIENINKMLNHSFINCNVKIKQDLNSLLKLMTIKYDVDNILSYKGILEIIEIYSKTISNDLWIQYLISRDESIHHYRSKINYLNFFVKDSLGNITILYVNYEKMVDYYKKIKINGNIKFMNLDMSNIDYFIKNINDLESHFMKIRENIDCNIYYIERENETMKTWKSLQDEFFQIAYHPILFKKIVLDEKEVSIYT